MTKAEQHYMSAVAQLPCCLCGDSPVELHHVREWSGLAQRAANCLVIPLCPNCHRGPNGVHGDKAMLKVNKTTEAEELHHTILKVYSKLLR